mmetsp:Transcript_51056/g.165244  ORF Transcript_51056/g.165244 Transcript_51056/m.165244 type:complete len:241 (-) Transcript_51056:8-730(-)
MCGPVDETGSVGCRPLAHVSRKNSISVREGLVHNRRQIYKRIHEEERDPVQRCNRRPSKPEPCEPVTLNEPIQLCPYQRHLLPICRGLSLDCNLGTHVVVVIRQELLRDLPRARIAPGGPELGGEAGVEVLRSASRRQGSLYDAPGKSHLLIILAGAPGDAQRREASLRDGVLEDCPRRGPLRGGTLDEPTGAGGGRGAPADGAQRLWWTGRGESYSEESRDRQHHHHGDSKQPRPRGQA